MTILPDRKDLEVIHASCAVLALHVEHGGGGMNAGDCIADDAKRVLIVLLEHEQVLFANDLAV